MLLRSHLSLACAWLAFLGITCIHAARKAAHDPYAKMFSSDSRSCFKAYRENTGKCFTAAIKTVPEDKRASGKWYSEAKCGVQYHRLICLIENSCSACSDETREELIAHMEKDFTSGECKSKKAPGSFDVSCSGVQAGVKALEKGGKAIADGGKAVADGGKAALKTVGSGLSTLATVAIVVLVVLVVVGVVAAVLAVVIKKKGSGEASTDSSAPRAKSTTGKSKSAKSKK